MAITWFSRFEGTTLSAVDDLPGTDTSVTLFGTAAINATAALVGSNGLQVLTTADNARVDSETGVINRLTGSCGLCLRVSTWTAGSTVCLFVGAAFGDNLTLYLVGASGGGNLRFHINEGGTGDNNIVTLGNAMVTGTTYFVTFSWDQPANSRRIKVYNFGTGAVVDSREDTSTAFTAPADLVASDGLRFGEANGAGAPAYFLDNAFIGSAYTDESLFLLNRAITSYTQYSSGASPDPDIDDLMGQMAGM